MTTTPVQCPRCKRVDWKEPSKGRKPHGLDSGSEVVPRRNKDETAIRTRGRDIRAVDSVRYSDVHDNVRPAHAVGCTSCGGLNGLHQKGCKA